jgi:hypothetical protein
MRLPDNDEWRHRFEIKSQTSKRTYIVAQHKRHKYWGCSCPAWRTRRRCKHLEEIGLPANQQPYEVRTMDKHVILPDGDELRVRIYDAPANGWRAMFVEIDGEIGLYPTRDQALTAIENYERADKGQLFEAELKVYLEAARTGKALGECGLPSLVRFGDHDPYSYATFTLPEGFVRKSELKIACRRNGETIRSAGWK